jgi:hypothetical protein
MRKTITVASLLASLAAVSLAAPLRMEPPAPKRPWIGEACRQDFSTLCPEMSKSSRREDIVDCLKKHSDSLSRDCSEAISDRPEATGTPRQGQGEHHRGHRMGSGGSFGRGPYDGSSF